MKGNALNIHFKIFFFLKSATEFPLPFYEVYLQSPYKVYISFQLLGPCPHTWVQKGFLQCSYYNISIDILVFISKSVEKYVQQLADV